MTAFDLYLRIGFDHILDRSIYTDPLHAEGYDHLLFIIVLVAVYSLSSWRRILLLVTAFTVGHSITLAMATFGWIPIPAKWIELFIPLTILFTAVLNILYYDRIMASDNHRVRYLTALCFGLIHGMGFSNYLRSQLMEQESIVIPLLGFNIGIEIGQLVIVAVFMTVGTLFERLGLSKKNWVYLISILVLGLTLQILYNQLRDW